MDARDVRAAARTYMGGLQDDLRAGVNALQASMWHPFGLQGPAPPWSFERGDDEAIVRIYLGNWRTITLASACALDVDRRRVEMGNPGIRRRRKPEGRPETPLGAAVGDGCQPGASARRWRLLRGS